MLHTSGKNLNLDEVCESPTNSTQYCNSLLSGITKSNLKRLTSIQYKAAKLVLTVNCWRAHGSKLHWLPMEKRIQFQSNSKVFYVFTVQDSVLLPIKLSLTLMNLD